MNPVQDYTRRELRHALKRADATIFEDVMQFLIDDCREFGSGYRKKTIWRYITRYPLTSEHIAHLQATALKYLERPMCGEFMPMCRTMARIATPEFWEVVKSKLEDENPRVRVNAYCLTPYAQGIEHGLKQSRELRRLKINLKKTYNYWGRRYPIYRALMTGDLIAVINEPGNWKHQHPVYQPIDPDEPPVIYFGGYISSDTQYNWDECIPEILIPKLERMLLDWDLYILTCASWLCIVYILHKLNQPIAVSILINFMKQKIEPKYFETTGTWMLSQAVCKVLAHFGTPEALEALERYKPRTQTALAHTMRERVEKWYFW